MLTATATRLPKFRACPTCGGVLLLLKLGRETIKANGWDGSRPVFECPSCSTVGQDSKPSDTKRTLVLL